MGTACSTPKVGVAVPTPRTKKRVVLLSTPPSMSRPGAKDDRSLISSTPRLRSDPSVNAVMESGTSCRLSERRLASTKTSSMSV